MKRIIFIIPVIALLFLTACNPNKDIYDNLGETVYTDDFSFTFSESDYVNVEKLGSPYATDEEKELLAFVKNNQCFTDEVPASKWVPYLLEDEYIAYGVSSKAMLTYNYSSNFVIGESYTLITEDYEAMGTNEGEPGYSEYFSETIVPNDFIPEWLPSNSPESELMEIKLVSYQYNDGASTFEKSSFYQLLTLNETDTLWGAFEGGYILTSEDYASMGAPGTHNNFSSDYSPNDFIPTFLNINFPYGYGAENATTIMVIYKFYASGTTKAYGREFYFDQTWSPKQKTEQYMVSSVGWVFDPTISFGVSAADYQSVVDIVSADPDKSYLVDSYGTAEYYYGSSAYYVNYDRRVSKRRTVDPDNFGNLTDFEALTLIYQRVNEGVIVMLQNKFPNATPQINGIDAFFIVTYVTYNDPGMGELRKVETVKLQCTAAASGGNPPQFTVVEDSAVIPITE